MDINNKSKVSQNKTKLLLLKKIKLKGFPELSKNLKEYFWNSDKYFQPKSKNHYILVGNKEKKKIKTSITTKRKIGRAKSKKFDISSHNSNEKKPSEESKRLISSPKRGISKNLKENSLKKGQKYINDLELEDLFNAYKQVHILNLKKANNFITVKKYLDNNSNFNILLTKTASNFNKFINDNNKKNMTNVDDEHKFISDISGGVEEEGKFFSPLRKISSNLNHTNNDDYYKTLSPFMPINSIKDNKDDIFIDFPSITNNNLNFSPISKMLLNNPINIDLSNMDKKAKTANNFFNLKRLEEKKVISRNNLIKRQKQYLLNSKEDDELADNKVQRAYFAKLLANQEQTLTKTNNNESKIKTLYNVLSKKSHKPKKNLLIKNIDVYRIKKELRNKIFFLNSKLEPEHNYNWIKDLREESLYNKKNNINYDSIRDPYNKTMYNITPKKNILRKKNMKYYKNLFDETNNINNNLEGLYVKGKNLLDIEYEQIKSLKNKKILNNYEKFLPNEDVEDIIFTDKKYINLKNQNI